MANPTWIDAELAVVVTGAAVVTIPVKPDRPYHLFHNGTDEAGAADTNTVFVGAICGKEPAAGAAEPPVPFTTDPTATWASGDGKFQLIYPRDVVVGPGYSSLKFITAAGAPTVSIAPDNHHWQLW